MKASVLYGVQDVRIDEVDIPELDRNDVLIKVEYCGICPSDLKYYTGKRKPKAWPTIRGHEFSGVIAERGPDVVRFEVGDRVVGHGRRPCGHCYFCLREGPNVNYCPNLQTSGIHSGGGTGAFAEYTKVSADCTYLIPDRVDFRAASFAEPLSCCLNAVMRSHIVVGDAVAVIGDGPNGLLIAQLAKLYGAGTAIVIGHHDARLEVALEIGADSTVNSKDVDPVQAVGALTDGRGADAVILAVGSQSAMQQGLQMARKEGLVNFFASSYPPFELSVDFNALLHATSISLVGSRDFQPFHFAKSLALMQTKRIEFDPLITHVLPLAQLEDGFQVMLARKGLKVLADAT